MHMPGRRSKREVIGFILLVLVAVTMFTIVVPIHSAIYGTPVAIALVLGAAMCAAPLLALAYPSSAIALFCGPAFLLPLFVSGGGVWPWPWSAPAIIAFAFFVAVISFVHGWKTGSVPLVVGVVSSLFAPLLRPDVAATNGTTEDLIVTASVTTFIYLLSILLAGRMRARDELTQERTLSAQEQSRRILMEERARIARELHDVVAHSMSLIQVQASTARYRVPGLADEAVAEFDDIAATARGSLTEMRRLLGVLRTEDQTAELLPQQGIEDIPTLVESTRRTGVDVALELVVVTPEIPPSVQIAAFRIVQEALSNAVRHAPGAAIAVFVRTEATTLRVRVRNTAADSPTTSGTGHGLRGMQERVTLLDGTLEAGPTADGGWAVVAVLNWHQQPVPTKENA